DAKKVRGVVAARRAQITADLVDALAAAWEHAQEPYQPLLEALLRACGEEKDDERARGLAAFLTASREERVVSRQREAVRGYTQAAQHFARAREIGWQASSSNNAGLLLKAQGEYEQALKQFRRAQELFQSLYPKDKYPDGHPLLAISR